MDTSQIDKCRAHIESLLASRGHAGLKETSYPSQSLQFLHNLQKGPELHETATPAQTSLKLNIIVVGAGIGGLATAIALRKRGHGVTVLERASELNDVGAGIQVPPNSSRLLLKWGLGPYLQDTATEPTAVRIRRWENGKVIGLTQLQPHFRERFHAPYYVVHRANLQLALYRLARDLGAVVRVNAGVKEYDTETPTVVLEDGPVISADLVVAADGIKSQARKVVLGGMDQPPLKAGYAAYRAIVETERMKADPDVSWLLDDPSQNVWIGDQHHVMAYPIAGGKFFNMVLSHPEDTDPSTWKQETAIEDMKKHFRGWDPRLVKVIDMIHKTLKWPLLSGTPLKNLVSSSGKLVIIGDAAHTMVPYMSVGAAMAVEDAAALAEILSLISSSSQLSSALKVFERVRILRTAQMQEASLVNGKLLHFADGPVQRARDEAMKVEVEGATVEHSPNQWTDPVTQRWVYGYDAERAIAQAWRDSLDVCAKL